MLDSGPGDWNAGAANHECESSTTYVCFSRVCDATRMPVKSHTYTQESEEPSASVVLPAVSEARVRSRDAVSTYSPGRPSNKKSSNCEKHSSTFFIYFHLGLPREILLERFMIKFVKFLVNGLIILGAKNC